jgi:excisionase family DNA binding protein
MPEQVAGMNTSWMPDAPLLLSVLQVAALLNVSERTVKRLLSNHQLVTRKVGTRTLVPRTSVENFLKKDHGTDNQKEKP